MEIPKFCEVIVIGGGVVGCATAYFLAKSGQDVLLVEKGNLASGASGRCSGMVMHCYGRDLNIDKTVDRLRWTKENTRILKSLPKELGVEVDFKQVGSFDIASTEEEWEDFERLNSIQKQAGDHEIELLDKDATLNMIPTLSDEIFGSRYRSIDGNIDPFKYTFAFSEGAKEHNAKILTQTKIIKIIQDKNKVKGVKTNRGEIKAKWVVNATNGWASQLVPESAIIPARELAMVTEIMPPLPPYPFEILCKKVEGDFASGYTQTPSGNLVLDGPGAPKYPGQNNFTQTITIEEVVKLASYLTNIYPSLSNANIIRCWAGTMGFTPDGLPSIGPMPDKEGLMIAAGFPDGMSWGAVVGRVIAEYINNGTTSLPIDLFNPGRFVETEIKLPELWDLTVLCEWAHRKNIEFGTSVSLEDNS